MVRLPLKSKTPDHSLLSLFVLKRKVSMVFDALQLFKKHVPPELRVKSKKEINLIGLLVLKIQNRVFLLRKNIFLRKLAGLEISKKYLWIMITTWIKCSMEVLFFDVCILMVFVNRHWNFEMLLSGFLKKYAQFSTSFVLLGVCLNWIAVTV